MNLSSIKTVLTRPLVSVSPRTCRVFTVCGLLLILLLVLSPTLATVGWHLAHGNTIQTRGKTVSVPWGWIAKIDDANDASLQRLSYAFFMNPTAANFESINIGPHVLSSKESRNPFDDFEKFFWNFHSDLGVEISGPIKMGSHPQEIFCMQATVPAKDRSELSCLILAGAWKADFIGKKRDEGAFFKVIQSLR